LNYSKIKKISIIGNSAAGKSTLSNELGERLKLNIFSIDKAFWLPGWTLRDEVSFKKIHDQWLSLDSWIIEGVGYWESMVDRITKSDRVIFLDVPASVCKAQAEKRIKEEKIFPNPNIIRGCVYSKVRDRQMKVIDNFHNDLRPRILELLSNLGTNRAEIISSIKELNIVRET